MEWNEHLQLAIWLRAIAWVFGAYFIGCFATGYYLVRARTRQDIRELGSGSTGARNVGRILGKSGFILTVAGDFLKGCLAVWLARKFSNDDFYAALAVPAVVAGHLWPAQLRFHGGKGVVTSLGALLVFDYRLALTFPVLFAVAFVFTRKTLLPAMFAFVCLPAVCWFFTQNNFTTVGMAVLSATILFAHRKNLGEEFSALKSEPPKI
jgi:acyl phosphate:glycerol-3-phosphate acyltransferase